MSQYKIFFDTSENMKKHKVKDVKLMITSPPYWDLKDYEAENQIGYNEDYDTYLNRLYKVWKNTFDVMQKDGVAIININTKSFKSSLKLLPNDFIKQMQKIGFYFKDIHYWHKSSGIPAKNNLKDNFEYFLIFSKSKNINFKKTGLVSKDNTYKMILNDDLNIEQLDFLKVDNYINQDDYIWLKEKIELRDYYRSNQL